MSTPNAKTRQLSLTEVLGEGFTGISVLSSNSESGDPNEPLVEEGHGKGTNKLGTPRIHNLTRR